MTPIDRRHPSGPGQIGDDQEVWLADECLDVDMIGMVGLECDCGRGLIVDLKVVPPTQPRTIS